MSVDGEVLPCLRRKAGGTVVKDPTKKSEWVLSWCAECRTNSSFWRVQDHTFRCMECGVSKEITEADHDRDGLLE